MERRTRRVQVKAELVFPPMAPAQPTPQGERMLPVPVDPTPPPPQPPPDEAPLGVYVISVTARILHMHPQTLRKYERLGLVRPSRSGGMVRYYSDQDLSRLRMIKYLVEERGMNLAGVEMALEMVAQLQAMREALAAQLATEHTAALQDHVLSVLEALHYAEQAHDGRDGRARHSQP